MHAGLLELDFKKDWQNEKHYWLRWESIWNDKRRKNVECGPQVDPYLIQSWILEILGYQEHISEGLKTIPIARKSLKDKS